MLNESIHYQNGALCCDQQPLVTIAEAVGTPCYVYSLPRILTRLERLKAAFAPLPIAIHYSAKANANLDILRALVQAAAGIDTVSGGEIWRARQAGCPAADIVFAGVGKTAEEIEFAVNEGVGWINIENQAECKMIQAAASQAGRKQRVALRLNPAEQAATQAGIATGHASAKFGLSAAVIRRILTRRAEFPALDFAGLHVHIGSQLSETTATGRAIDVARALLEEFPDSASLNIGGGFPVRYRSEEKLPHIEEFVASLRPKLAELPISEPLMVEPGRFLVADAGVLLTRVLYTKRQLGQTTVIVDASMSELLRPALYDAHHEIIPLNETGDAPRESMPIVGPVCETTDALNRRVVMPLPQPGDFLAILTVGAYGMVMANNYNARPRPAEVVVIRKEDGTEWRLSRAREDWQSFYPGENRRPLD